MALMETLNSQNQLIIRQRKELIELIGFETRNKYEICNERGEVIGFCAEQQKGLFGILMRHLLGHWRSFELHVFDNQRREVFIVSHPFRFFFQRLEIYTKDRTLLGSLQQRFSVLRKKFDVEDAQGRVQLRMNSGLLQFWTFPIYRREIEVAVIRKKWSGLLKETFLDADNFQIEFKGSSLTEIEKSLLLAAGIFVDIQYFERKANKS